MFNEIIVNATKEEIRVALIEGGQLAELLIERRKDTSLIGNIYKGRVIRVLPGMQSAFVDICCLHPICWGSLINSLPGQTKPICSTHKHQQGQDKFY